MKRVSTSTTTTSVGPDFPHNLPRDPLVDLESIMQHEPAWVTLRSGEGSDFRQLETYALAAVDNERRFRAFYIDEAHLSAGPRPYQRDMLRAITEGTGRIRASLDLFAWSSAGMLSSMDSMRGIWTRHALSSGTVCHSVGYWMNQGPHVDAHRGHVSALHFARTLVDTGKFARPAPFEFYDELIYSDPDVPPYLCTPEFELALSQHPDVVAAYERRQAARHRPITVDWRRNKLPGHLARHYTTEKSK